MISVAATIRPLASPHALAALGRRLRRFDAFPSPPDGTLVMVPGVGRVLLRESPTELVLALVLDDDRALQRVSPLILDELDGATVVGAYRDTFSIRWDRASHVPAALR
jgi:hypothetical protein